MNVPTWELRYLQQNRKLDENEIAQKLASLDGWRIQDGKLSRSFKFAGFEEAIAFIVRIALEIEKIDHHPEMVNEYSTVTFRLTTHKIRNPDGTVSSGISLLDFELASRIDAHFRNYTSG
ncbi:MAG: 4a-hydroxytetrahydrobiopterin dehydratase [Thermoplasmata archaeon YP2-bin.285]|uniref:Putative pterin-4-alpha-carbinolamine dehydratase n=2 Tax=Candidatus Sysuiplasma superficiale TaxID=2823368 RepID=A0A8J8CBI6_9ARCH|nr:4a-hydroxytetrahydrobiopterin dehydratase [Candidatus Sysuiplasma superficiale]